MNKDSNLPPAVQAEPDLAGSVQRLVKHPDVLVYVHIEYRRGDDVLTMLRGLHPNGDLVEMAAFMSKCVDKNVDDVENQAKRQQANNPEAPEAPEAPDGPPRLSEHEKKWREFRDSLPPPKTEDA